MEVKFIFGALEIKNYSFRTKKELLLQTKNKTLLGIIFDLLGEQKIYLELALHFFSRLAILTWHRFWLVSPIICGAAFWLLNTALQFLLNAFTFRLLVIPLRLFAIMPLCFPMFYFIFLNNSSSWYLPIRPSCSSSNRSPASY